MSVKPEAEKYAEEYEAASARSEELAAELVALRDRITPLVAEREGKAAEVTRLMKRMKALKELFAASTGLDLRKYLRGDTQRTIDQSYGALVAAVCDPCNLPVDDPIVIRRLAALRDAIHAHRDAKAARRQPADAEKEGGP